jgi:predicted nucleic-acid-binding Zn-ribbon protein
MHSFYPHPKQYPFIQSHHQTVQQERENQVSKPIQIRPLSEQETAKLMNTARFNVLSPTRCMSCGNTSDFERQVFWIEGVPKAEQNSDNTQALIAYHLKERHGVGSVFFKAHQNKFYVDSAKCKRCASTIIEFDIEFSDQVLAKISQLTATPIEKLKGEMEALAGRIGSDPISND